VGNLSSAGAADAFIHPFPWYPAREVWLLEVHVTNTIATRHWHLLGVTELFPWGSDLHRNWNANLPSSHVSCASYRLGRSCVASNMSIVQLINPWKFDGLTILLLAYTNRPMSISIAHTLWIDHHQWLSSSAMCFLRSSRILDGTCEFLQHNFVFGSNYNFQV